MTYYILLGNDSVEDIWDENILGEESFETFYTGNGFKALNNIVIRQPDLLETVTIIDGFNYKMENNVLTFSVKVEYI